MKPIRFLINQIEMVKNGKITMTIRPNDFSNSFYHYHIEKWFYVKEPFFVDDDKSVVYYPDSRFKIEDFVSDKMMPMEYARFFISISKFKRCKLFSIDEKHILQAGFDSVKDFHMFFKEKYGILYFSTDPLVYIYQIHKSEQLHFNDFVKKYFGDGRIL